MNFVIVVNQLFLKQLKSCVFIYLSSSYLYQEWMLVCTVDYDESTQATNAMNFDCFARNTYT